MRRRSPSNAYAHTNAQLISTISPSPSWYSDASTETAKAIANAARQSYVIVNTAVDFDENRNKLVYHVFTTETLSWNFYTMETRTNCPQERFAHDITLVARAII